MGKSLPPKQSDELVLQEKGYRLYKKLGEGSYAPVYFTEYRGSKNGEEPKKLACKVIDTRKAPKDFVKKFLPRELEVLALINHPHIIHVQSIFESKQRIYIFMSIAEKGDLLDYLLKNGHTNEGRARVWFRQITLAVQYLHEMGIAHRDLKCENCLISGNNNLKLADFGFARFVVDAEGQNICSSTYCGSLNYAAPEVLRGSPYYPKSSDCWSMGVILYAMLNKSMPFEDKNVRNLINQQTQRRWRFRSKVVDLLSEEVKAVTKRLLDPEPSTRWKVAQVLESEWIRMDPRLIQLTPEENKCLTQAKQEFAKHIEKLKHERASLETDHNSAANSKLKILKEAENGKESDKSSLIKSEKFTLDQDLITIEKREHKRRDDKEHSRRESSRSKKSK